MVSGSVSPCIHPRKNVVDSLQSNKIRYVSNGFYSVPQEVGNDEEDALFSKTQELVVGNVSIAYY